MFRPLSPEWCVFLARLHRARFFFFSSIFARAFANQGKPSFLKALFLLEASFSPFARVEKSACVHSLSLFFRGNEYFFPPKTLLGPAFRTFFLVHGNPFPCLFVKLHWGLSGLLTACCPFYCQGAGPPSYLSSAARTANMRLPWPPFFPKK